jgi:hypothetical protein
VHKDELGHSKLCNGASNFQLFYISPFFSLFLYNSFSLFLNYLLSLAPLSYTATRCKALRKPTEQPVKQWYASLVGKVPTRCFRKVVAMAFKRCEKLCYVDSVSKENEEELADATAVTREEQRNREPRQATVLMRQRAVVSGVWETVVEHGRACSSKVQRVPWQQQSHTLN